MNKEMEGAQSPSETPEEHAGVLPKRQVRLIFLALIVAMLMSSLGQMVFSTALPTIVGELHGVDQMVWISTAYILCATIMMPIYGKIGDVYGRKPIILMAVSLFIGGSVVGGLATNMMALIIARAIQGLGGGGLMILSQAIIADIVPPKDRGRYMGIMGAVFGLSAVAGPLLGGWFTDSLSWRLAFWINVPLGALSLLALVVWLKIPRYAQSDVKIDYLGTALMMMWVSALVLFTAWGGNEYAWDSWQILSLIGATVVLMVAFFVVEKYASTPLMPLHLFKNRNFNLVTAASLIIAIAMFGAIGYMPTYLQIVHGSSPTVSGLQMLSMVAGIMISSVASGQIAARTSHYKWMIVISPVITAVGLYVLSTLKVDTSILVLMTGVFIVGFGIGIGQQLMTLVAQNEFPIEEVGTATGTTNFYREIGATLGASVVGGLFTSRLHTYLSERVGALGTGGNVDITSIEPHMIHQLPEQIKAVVLSSYSDALTPIFLWIIPVLVIAFVCVVFVKETPLAETIERKAD